jgi:hypothetical protein
MFRTGHVQASWATDQGLARLMHEQINLGQRDTTTYHLPSMSQLDQTPPRLTSLRRYVFSGVPTKQKMRSGVI